MLAALSIKFKVQVSVFLLPLLLPLMRVVLAALPRLLAGERPSIPFQPRGVGFGSGNTEKNREQLPGPKTGPRMLPVREPTLSKSVSLVPGSQFVQGVHHFGALDPPRG